MLPFSCDVLSLTCCILQVNVCGVPGCSTGDSAANCLPSSLLLYLKVTLDTQCSHLLPPVSDLTLQDIVSLCERRALITCPTLYTPNTAAQASSASGSTSSPQLIVSRDPALMRIVSYVFHHSAAPPHSAQFREAPKIHYVTGRSVPARLQRQ